MSFVKFILQDWAVNAGNVKARGVLLWLRVCQKIRNAPRPLFLIGSPVLVLYRVVVEWVLGIELPWGVKLGENARLFHGTGLVVNDKSVIGRNVVLRHCTTIGVRETREFGADAAPVIGDDVDIGANVTIVGPIRVGDGARIGAGAVVVKDVPSGAIVVGNPARIVGGDGGKSSGSES